MALALGLCEWGLRDWWAGARVALPGSPAERLSQDVGQWFEQAFGVPALPLDSGSTALQLALATLRAEGSGRDEVVVPALACPAVSRSVRAAGCQPVYSEIGDDLNSPCSAIADVMGPRTLAVVMVHAYGHPANGPAIAALCRAEGVPLIDDAAQRIDPASRLGTLGDFGIISFAQSKSVVCGTGRAGGVLLINDAERASAVQAAARHLQPGRVRWLDWLEFGLSAAWPGLAYPLARLRRQRSLAGSGSAMGRLGAQEASIALSQLASREARFSRRRGVLEAYAHALQAMKVPAPQLRDGTEYLARLMVRVRADGRDACRQALAARRIETRLPYPLPAHLPADRCRRACRLAPELLELPMPRHLSPVEAERVAALVAPFAAEFLPT